MNNYSYLDISSSYRNRQRYPLTSNFEVLFSDSGQRTTSFDAYDPYGSSTASFPPSNLESGDSYSSEFYITATPLTNTYQVDGVVLNGNDIVNPENENNFYVGQTLEFGTETRTIKSYTIDDQDTTYFTGTAGGTTSAVILTGTQSDIDDYYVGKTLNIGGESRTIIDYAQGSDTATVFPPFSSTPSGAATITGPTYLVELESDFTSAPTASIPVTDATAELARIRGEPPAEYGAVTTTASPTTSILIGMGLNDIYTGNYVQLWNSTNAANTYNSGVSEYVQILSYDAVTGLITLAEPFTGAATTYDYAIIQFTGDNHHPINYTGSRVSSQQAVCHEVSLVSLTLPNLTLKTGGKIAFKPYVYVELTNLSSPTPTHIWSNNPNSNRALFKVSVNDNITEPTTNPFVTLLCQCMDQTIIFKPNDNFRFAVRLPSGEYFEVTESEYFSPSATNPNIQIDALFKVKRVCNPNKR